MSHNFNMQTYFAFTGAAAVTNPLYNQQAGERVLAPIGTGRPRPSLVLQSSSQTASSQSASSQTASSQTAPSQTAPCQTAQPSVEQLAEKFAALNLLGPSRNRPAPLKGCLKPPKPMTPPIFWRPSSRDSNSSDKHDRSPRRPRRRNARRRAAFRAGRRIATCLETDTAVLPSAVNPNARMHFRRRHTLRVHEQEYEKLQANGFWNEDPDYTNWASAEALAGSRPQDFNSSLDDHHDSFATGQGGTDDGYPSEKVLDRRLQLAIEAADRASVHAIKHGALDFALFVCNFGSRLHHRAARSFQKHQHRIRIGSYKGLEQNHTVPGAGHCVAMGSWYFDIPSAMSAHRSVFFVY